MPHQCIHCARFNRAYLGDFTNQEAVGISDREIALFLFQTESEFFRVIPMRYER